MSVGEAAMQPRLVLLIALLVAAFVADGSPARPFSVNRTEVLRALDTRNKNRPRARPVHNRALHRRSLDALEETTVDGREDACETCEILITLPTIRPFDVPTPATTITPLQRDRATTIPPSSPYWANDSLVGMPLACADADKRCLEANRLVDPATGRCYSLGDRRPCERPAVWAVDKAALDRGRVQGRCYKPVECDRFLVRMAYDGRCYNMSYVSNWLCGADATVVQHFFGDAECSGIYGAEKPRQAQPTSAGRCALPELRPAPAGAVAECDAGAVACGERGLLAAPSGACAAPLSIGECPAGEHVVLDADALRGGRLRARCAPRHPCGQGQVSLGGACRSRAAAEELCAGEALLQMPTGRWECGGGSGPGSAVNLVVQYAGEGYCKVLTTVIGTSQTVFVDVGNPNCPRDDAGNCLTPVDIQETHAHSIMDED